MKDSIANWKIRAVFLCKKMYKHNSKSIILQMNNKSNKQKISLSVNIYGHQKLTGNLTLT